MCSAKTLNEWLALLEQRHHTSIDLGLDRVRLVAERMGITRPHGTVITVAGTNGKGSCIRSLETSLRSAGFTTGAYSSPHLQSYNERIRLNGVDASDEAIVSAFEAVEEARGEIGLSYFEAGTLASMWLFDQLRVDFWLLEVGLGGRLDAVNIIDTDVAIVTSIALDHEAWLGSDRRQIAKEKIGIVRPVRPVFIGELDPPDGMLEHAELLCSLPYLIQRDFGFSRLDNGLSISSLTRYGKRVEDHISPSPRLPHPSVTCAVAALTWLGVISDRHRMNVVLSETQMAGRMQQIVAYDRKWILDVGHNPAAAQYICERPEVQSTQRIVLGMVHDKDVNTTLSVFSQHFKQWHLATPDAGGREASAQSLADELDEKLECQVASSVQDAMQGALEASQNGDTILVTGSFFTVGAALTWLDKRT
jgi:dihydrofolate synthase/folylpolyglutamate synthase